jgi:hypothetical protein
VQEKKGAVGAANRCNLLTQQKKRIFRGTVNGIGGKTAGATRKIAGATRR